MFNKSEFTKEQLIEAVKSRMEINRYLLENSPRNSGVLLEVALNLKADEIALAALTAKPFMYGIEDCDGMAYFAEHCVSSNPAHLSDELHASDDESGEGSKVVALYRLPLVEGLNNDQ